ncbi:hypothetical protein CNPV328 [Canarypox virus]|uniref:Uncharacterized protein CNPV001 n=2 Tax=Avipoxvirus TaxID=10260 RepID=Q6VZ19_CNPV|nr:hypothetical protein CNPV001 [Canarypox virus]NP_955351.1 hypothetical protein CNPV328 [Canarypox virus]AAR83347.1 CNPV001 hypothetical protein [Canarypox virus]AAR83674.1 CNPV328 hypothetical protein [Canarypox virus]AWD84477.1 hypothetical protein CNPV001 [Canarypox virus]AWD84804.1 hypothetical protein CNPV328 [Canarypox virus]
MDSKKQNPDPNYLMLSVDYGNGKKVYYTENTFCIMVSFILFVIIFLSMFTILACSYVYIAIIISLILLFFGC